MDRDHPHWCARAETAEDPDHKSRWIPVQISDTDLTGLKIQLWEPRDLPGNPVFIILEFLDDDEPVHHFLPTEQARVLTHRLRTLLRAV